MDIRGLVERILQGEGKFNIVEINCNGPGLAPTMRFEIRPEGLEAEEDTLYTARELRKILLEYVDEKALSPCQSLDDGYCILLPRQYVSISEVNFEEDVILHLLSLKSFRDSNLRISFSSYSALTVLFYDERASLALKSTASLLDRGFKIYPDYTASELVIAE